MSPRISAPTVAEHRARRSAALMDAARRLLLDRGADAVTPAAVGAAAGLARSSVYEYFPTAADLLAAMVVDSFARWAAAVRSSVDAAGPGRPAVDAYVRATLRLVAAGEHRIAAALSGVTVPPARRDDLRRMHDDLRAPLVAALAELGVDDPPLRAALVQGCVDAAARRVEAGEDAGTVVEAVLDLVWRGLGTGPG